MSTKQRRLFTEEQKADAVKIAEQSDKPLSQVAKDLGISDGALRKWVSQARIDAGQDSQGALATRIDSSLARSEVEIRAI